MHAGRQRPVGLDGDIEIEGQVKVKLGPLSLTYKGTAKFVEKDQANHTIVIEATGKETRGAGTASAHGDGHPQAR